MSYAQLRKNSKGRFIIFSLLGIGGQARTVIFPEDAKAEGSYEITRILKEILISQKGKSLLLLLGVLLLLPGLLWAGTGLLLMLFELLWVVPMTHN